MGDTLGTVDENAQNATAAGTQQLDVDDFESLGFSDALRNFGDSGDRLFFTNDWHSLIAIKKWAFAHWPRSTVSLYTTGNGQSPWRGGLLTSPLRSCTTGRGGRQGRLSGDVRRGQVMRRRDFLETAALTAMTGFGAGCTVRRASVTTPPLPHAAINLAVPRISWERVIRTTIGLRPHRDSGFVLKAEKLDSKTVIHDYGFGGTGMSLAWGCGAMAANMALQQSERRVAVLGCGSPGLTAARQLQRRGFEVTIYAMSVPPDTTSNKSYAGFTPTTALVANERRTAAWDAQFRQAAEISYRQLQLLVGAPGYGVYWIDSYNAIDDPNPPAGG